MKKLMLMAGLCLSLFVGCVDVESDEPDPETEAAENLTGPVPEPTESCNWGGESGKTCHRVEEGFAWWKCDGLSSGECGSAGGRWTTGKSCWIKSGPAPAGCT